MGLQGLLCGCFATPRASGNFQAVIPQKVPAEVVGCNSNVELHPKDDDEAFDIVSVVKDSANSIANNRSSMARMEPGVDYQYGLATTNSTRAPLSSRALVGGIEYATFFVNPLAEGSHEGGVPISFAGAALVGVGCGHNNPLAAEYSEASFSAASTPLHSASVSAGASPPDSSAPEYVKACSMVHRSSSGGDGDGARQGASDGSTDDARRSATDGGGGAVAAGDPDSTCPAAPGTPLQGANNSKAGPVGGCRCNDSACSERSGSLLDLPEDAAPCFGPDDAGNEDEGGTAHEEEQVVQEAVGQLEAVAGLQAVAGQEAAQRVALPESDGLAFGCVPGSEFPEFAVCGSELDPGSETGYGDRNEVGCGPLGQDAAATAAAAAVTTATGCGPGEMSQGKLPRPPYPPSLRVPRDSYGAAASAAGDVDNVEGACGIVQSPFLPAGMVPPGDPEPPVNCRTGSDTLSEHPKIELGGRAFGAASAGGAALGALTPHKPPLVELRDAASAAAQSSAGPQSSPAAQLGERPAGSDGSDSNSGGELSRGDDLPELPLQCTTSAPPRVSPAVAVAAAPMSPGRELHTAAGAVILQVRSLPTEAAASERGASDDVMEPATVLVQLSLTPDLEPLEARRAAAAVSGPVPTKPSAARAGLALEEGSERAEVAVKELDAVQAEAEVATLAHKEAATDTVLPDAVQLDEVATLAQKEAAPDTVQPGAVQLDEASIQELDARGPTSPAVVVAGAMQQSPACTPGPTLELPPQESPPAVAPAEEAASAAFAAASADSETAPLQSKQHLSPPWSPPAEEQSLELGAAPPRCADGAKVADDAAPATSGTTDVHAAACPAEAAAADSETGGQPPVPEVGSPQCNQTRGTDAAAATAIATVCSPPTPTPTPTPVGAASPWSRGVSPQDPGCSITGLAMTRMLIRQLGLIPPQSPMAAGGDGLSSSSLEAAAPEAAAVVMPSPLRSPPAPRLSAAAAAADWSPPASSPFAAAFGAAEAALWPAPAATFTPGDIGVIAASPVLAAAAVAAAVATTPIYQGRDSPRVVESGRCGLFASPMVDDGVGIDSIAVLAAAVAAAELMAAVAVGSPLSPGGDARRVSQPWVVEAAAGADELASSIPSTRESSVLLDERSSYGASYSVSQLSARSLQGWMEPQGWKPLRERYCATPPQ